MIWLHYGRWWVGRYRERVSLKSSGFFQNLQIFKVSLLKLLGLGIHKVCIYAEQVLTNQLLSNVHSHTPISKYLFVNILSNQNMFACSWSRNQYLTHAFIIIVFFVGERGAFDGGNVHLRHSIWYICPKDVKHLQSF